MATKMVFIFYILIIFFMPWSERSRISQDTRSLFNLEGEEEDVTFAFHGSPTSHNRRDAEDVQKLVRQLNQFDVFRVNVAESSDMEENSTIPLVSLVTKDIAPTDVVDNLLMAKDRGLQHVANFVQERSVEQTVGFHEPIKRHLSKTFASVYKAFVPIKPNIQKTIKADRQLMQRLLNAITADRIVQMVNVLKHELSPIPLSLAKVGGDMNTTAKSDLINLLMDQKTASSELPNSTLQKCILIDGHALIQAIGKSADCVTFDDYAKVFFSSIRNHFSPYTTCCVFLMSVDVIFDRYVGTQSIKASTRTKRASKKKPIRKVIDGPQVPLPEIWKNFIALEANKADLPLFLTKYIMDWSKDLSEQFELVTAGGFSEATNVWSSR